MKKLIIDKIARVVRNRKKLETKLKVKISNRGKEVYIEGRPENEFIAEKIIDALNFGFPFSTVMLIKDEDNEFEIINIKDYTNRKKLEQIRGRLIGKKGKAFKTLSDLTNCYFELKDNQVGIIGEPEEIKHAQEAVTSIIKGSKHGNVYKYLEKQNTKPISDLGLKDERLG